MADFDPKLMREAMRLAGLTAAELAERAGLHRVWVANFARGLPPSEDTWNKLEKALKRALDEHARAVEKMRKAMR